MNDSVEAARNDLAFMKAVVEDRGPLPALFGAHMLAPGLIYGANFILIWAIWAHLVPWPHAWRDWTWAPGAIVYAPIVTMLSRRKIGLGPSGRTFAAAGAAFALMVWATLAVIATAQAASGDPAVWMLWPPMVFVLYGGAWSVVCMVRRTVLNGLVALGCFATAVTAAACMKAPEAWLVLGAGALLFVAGPGAAIIRRAREPA
jgi:hypothetical protein